ncbi:MAG: response regulator [Pseudomonadales bacterium]|nr:response regulator [Pseudomonadales bacterium]
MHILLIEDDALLGDGIEQGLTALGFTVAWVTRAADALAAWKSTDFDVLILDLGLPDRDGRQALVQWRRAGLHQPVLILTARDAVADRIDGLNAGADDYLVKPFDLDELAARLQALLRRCRGASQPLIEHGRLCVDPQRQQVWLAGQPVPLPRREMSLLLALLQSRGRLLTADQLADRVYGWVDGVESNALAVHIHNLRRKLGNRVVETVRGGGYRLGAPL